MRLSLGVFKWILSSSRRRHISCSWSRCSFDLSCALSSLVSSAVNARLAVLGMLLRAIVLVFIDLNLEPLWLFQCAPCSEGHCSVGTSGCISPHRWRLLLAILFKTRANVGRRWRTLVIVITRFLNCSLPRSLANFVSFHSCHLLSVGSLGTCCLFFLGLLGSTPHFDLCENSLVDLLCNFCEVCQFIGRNSGGTVLSHELGQFERANQHHLQVSTPVRSHFCLKLDEVSTEDKVHDFLALISGQKDPDAETKLHGVGRNERNVAQNPKQLRNDHVGYTAKQIDGQLNCQKRFLMATTLTIS